jgi:hypothetical protein
LIDKAYLRKLDKSAEKRVGEITQSWERRKPKASEVYASDQVRENFSKNRPALLTDRYDVDSVCVTLPFYESVAVEVCRYCPCTNDLDSMNPLLDEGIVVPVLVSKYESYPRAFIENLIKYPHISTYEESALKLVSVEENEADIAWTCANCVAEERRRSEAVLKNYGAKKSEFYRNGLDLIAKQGRPAVGLESPFLTDALSSMCDDNVIRFRQIVNMSKSTNAFRTASAINAVLQIPMSVMDEAASLEKQYPSVATNYDDAGLRKAVASGLSISYNRRIGLRKYLDIVLPRRKTIASIVGRVLSHGKGSGDLIEVQEEIEEINSQVRKLSGSALANVYEYSTNLMLGNGGIIAKCIVAAALGFAFGGPFAMVGAGASTGLVTKLSTEGHLPAVRFPKGRKIVEVLEPGYQKLLAYTLQKNFKDVQLWELQRKLQKISPRGTKRLNS